MQIITYCSSVKLVQKNKQKAILQRTRLSAESHPPEDTSISRKPSSRGHVYQQKAILQRHVYQQKALLQRTRLSAESHPPEDTSISRKPSLQRTRLSAESHPPEDTSISRRPSSRGHVYQQKALLQRTRRSAEAIRVSGKYVFFTVELSTSGFPFLLEY